ncbi:MAG: molecular chaperone [Gemmatimonadaceae bacterium]|nr:molecular chaperone [Gloeobacterales cyanobacterium ES-bin-141]
MSATFEPAGNRSTQTFEVESMGDQPVAVQLHLVSRQVALDGTETNPDAEDDFLIYPPQILLRPGQSQTVRVSWVGDANPKQELAYRLITEQVPIDLEQQTVQTNGISVKINTVFRYVGSLFITPRGAAPQLSIGAATHHQSKERTDQLAVTVENRGTAHQLLKALKLTVTAIDQSGRRLPNATVQLSEEQLQAIRGENLLAGHSRLFFIPWPEQLPVGPVEVVIEPAAPSL